MINIFIIGDPNVGKTVFINRLKSGEFLGDYVHTESFNVNEIKFNTNKGKVGVRFWDISGSKDIGEVYPREGIDGFIIMFDVTNRQSYENLPKWIKQAEYYQVPIVIVGNKVDVNDRKVKPMHIKIPKEYRIKYFDVSVKSVYGMREALEYLLEGITGEDNIEMVSY